MYSEPIIETVGFNIHVERLNDPSAKQLCVLIHSFGLFIRVHGSTNNQRGTLNIVACRNDHNILDVSVLDMQLSDYILICWKSAIPQPSAVYRTGTRWL